MPAVRPLGPLPQYMSALSARHPRRHHAAVAGRKDPQGGASLAAPCCLQKSSLRARLMVPAPLPEQAIAMVRVAIDGGLPQWTEPLRIGDRVRVKPGVIPSLGWGNVRSTSIGLVVRIDGDRCDVDFPGHQNWHGKVHEIELIAEPIAVLKRAIEAAERNGHVPRTVLSEARSTLEAIQKTEIERPLTEAMAVRIARRAAARACCRHHLAEPPPRRP